VRELVNAAHRLVEEVLGFVWLEGELSGLKAPGSGHIYFSLKDSVAQIPCVMWRSAVQRLRFRPAEGSRVLVRGRLGVFEEAGRLQLYVENIEPTGAGAAALALEQLRQRLAKEGLFAVDKKRTLPRWPRRIGVVTSSSGAAVHDIVRVISRRCPTPILISPARVQGEGAAQELVRALERLARLADVDVVIVGRGGGSSEDLSAFNDEAVVRAIARHRVPVVSAVGHQVDITLADLAADLRAATPTAAGELCVPDRAELLRELRATRSRLERTFGHLVAQRRHALERLVARLPAPAAQVGRARQKLDDLLARAQQVLGTSLRQRHRALALLDVRRAAAHPRARLAADASALATLEHRLRNATRGLLVDRQRRLQRAAGQLQALSPLAVLERGYAVVRSPEGHVITDASQPAAGARLEVRLHRGTLEVQAVKPKPDGEG
jgi:exodeoxyribonuclease VII large subunit